MDFEEVEPEDFIALLPSDPTIRLVDVSQEEFNSLTSSGARYRRSPRVVNPQAWLKIVDNAERMRRERDLGRPIID